MFKDFLRDIEEEAFERYFLTVTLEMVVHLRLDSSPKKIHPEAEKQISAWLHIRENIVGEENVLTTR